MASDQTVAQGAGFFGRCGKKREARLFAAVWRVRERAHTSSYVLRSVRIVTICYEPRAFVVRRIVCLDLDVDVYCRRRPSNSSFHTGASQRRALHGKVYLRDTVTNAARRRAQRTFSE